MKLKMREILRKGLKGIAEREKMKKMKQVKKAKKGGVIDRARCGGVY